MSTCTCKYMTVLVQCHVQHIHNYTNYYSTYIHTYIHIYNTAAMYNEYVSSGRHHSKQIYEQEMLLGFSTRMHEHTCNKS